VVYLHINRELDFWYSSGIMVFPMYGPCKAGGSGTDKGKNSPKTLYKIEIKRKRDMIRRYHKETIWLLTDTLYILQKL
jgi:hypothetical protein